MLGFAGNNDLFAVNQIDAGSADYYNQVVSISGIAGFNWFWWTRFTEGLLYFGLCVYNYMKHSRLLNCPFLFKGQFLLQKWYSWTQA